MHGQRGTDVKITRGEMNGTTGARVCTCELSEGKRSRYDFEKNNGITLTWHRNPSLVVLIAETPQAVMGPD